jgi:hypothetical protein
VVLVEAVIIGINAQLVPEIKVILEQVEVNPQMQAAVAAAVAILLEHRQELAIVVEVVETAVHISLEETQTTQQAEAEEVLVILVDAPVVEANMVVVEEEEPI